MVTIYCHFTMHTNVESHCCIPESDLSVTHQKSNKVIIIEELHTQNNEAVIKFSELAKQ